MKKMLRLLITLMLTLSVAIPVYAADGNVKYSGHAGDFIFEPGSKYSPTDLFPNFKDVMPGDTISQKIVVRNNGDTSVKISMRSLGATEDSVKFLSQLTLTVVQKTDTKLFEAPADQKAQLTEWRELGTLAAGGEVELEVTLKVPTSLDNDDKNLIGYIDWEFLAEELEGTGPKTGDYMNYLPWAIGLTGSAVLIILLIVKRRKDQEEETN